MIDLRNYSQLITELVEQENKKDRNWKWSVKYLGISVVRIGWTYLNYIGEKNTFKLEMDNEKPGSGTGDWLWAKSPNGDRECYLVVEGKPNPNLGAEMNIESAIRSAIDEISYIAHSRY